MNVTKRKVSCILWRRVSICKGPGMGVSNYKEQWGQKRADPFKGQDLSRYLQEELNLTMEVLGGHMLGHP